MQIPELTECESWEAIIKTFNDYLSLSLSTSFNDTEEGIIFFIEGEFVSASVSFPDGDFSLILKKTLNKELNKEMFDEPPYREIWAVQTLFTRILEELAEMSGEDLPLQGLPNIGRA